MSDAAMNHVNEERLVLYYYGETAGDVEQHLASCESCRGAYQTLQRVLNSVDSFPVPERGADYEAQVWRTVERRVGRRSAFSPRFSIWRPMMAAAAMAALLVVAFVAGRAWRRPALKGNPVAVADSQVRERILMVAVGDHLERSQVVLAELANSGDPQRGALDISYEQRTAQDLVESNRLYRQTAASAGDNATANLLDELERVLLDIAHSPAQVSGAQLEGLRKEIEGRGILFKVKVFSSQVEEREAAQHAPAL
jgi:hypothetical protein